jgi:hypothetical protein
MPSGVGGGGRQVDRNAAVLAGSRAARGSMGIVRSAALLVALSLLAGAAVGDAAAHGGTPGPGYRSTASGIEPPLPGLLVEVLDGEILSVRNWTGKEVSIDGADGKPLVHFVAGAVKQRDGRGWRVVRRGTSHAWHDPRVHWTGPTPERSGLVTRWTIPGTADGKPFVIRGFIGYTKAVGERGDEKGLSAVATAGIVAVGLLALAALALPLVLRKDKGEPERAELRGP